ncbi:hypothetical protein [Kumtagia ephedrae]|uniref:Uncharacterized protein n=1 Tax=Kumtagia ephedrae TaxID=2116701 RepID=A0A2P7SGW8_9HYPH|nr:hypothetical protein [Mesorhizobium ephedrae]PSJ61728.1 hypothetical protein C7I84_08980 [Mesorhizobium ephedrae]
MSFSQAWDAGFRALLLYVGIVFVWLGLIEGLFSSQSTSVVVMNVVAVAIAVAFFLRARRRAVAERARAEAEVRALVEEHI